MKPIPYGTQWIDEDDIQAVTNALKGSWLTQGPIVEEFEEAIASYVGTKYAVAFNSGTSALHGAMYAAGVNENDEVITSPLTFVATSNSALYLGAHPRFVDIDVANYCLDIYQIAKVITKKTKVIAPVDFAGFPVDLTKLRNVVKADNITIIEDAAHALGAKRNGIMVGHEADMTMFSFHPVKHITTGEGGIIVTDNDEFYNRLNLFKTHGITKDPCKLLHNEGPWYYEMQELGYNYRITDFQCALGITQLKKIETFIERRIEIARVYDETFSSYQNLITVPPKPLEQDSRHAYHLYPILVKNNKRKEVFLRLREKGIFCQVHYVPVHTQPFYQDKYGFKKGDYPMVEKYYEETLSLPMFPKMTDNEVSYVIESVLEAIK